MLGYCLLIAVRLIGFLICTPANHIFRQHKNKKHMECYLIYTLCFNTGIIRLIYIFFRLLCCGIKPLYGEHRDGLCSLPPFSPGNTQYIVFIQ